MRSLVAGAGWRCRGPTEQPGRMLVLALKGACWSEEQVGGEVEV